MVHPSGIYTKGNEYVAPAGAGYFFVLGPRVCPYRAYTLGYDINYPPGIGQIKRMVYPAFFFIP